MSYNSDFERALIQRSLELVRAYNGPYDATLLLNCLLGLLIVPKESCINAIPLDPLENLGTWGVAPSSIKAFGNANGADDDPRNLRGFVWHLRNSVAHFRFRPIPDNGEVKAFDFRDKSGFHATVQLAELRVFVERLAMHLEAM